MVKHLIFILVCAFSMFGYSLEGVKIEVEVQDAPTSEHQPLFAKIIIHHPPEERVDELSFTLDGKPLHAEYFGHNQQYFTTWVNGNVVNQQQCISFYITQIPTQPTGQHLLGQVEVKVGNQLYRSSPTSYAVRSIEFSSGFQLQAFIDAPKTLYPGQTFTATYRIITDEPMEWVYEHLPLLDLKDFRAIGKRSSRIYYQNKCCIQEISQVYEAKKAGDFQIEPSLLEGRIYAEDFFGRRRYTKEVQKAQAEPLVIAVHDFPLKDKPNTFNGAIGDFTFTAMLDSSHQVYVGDKLKLKLIFQGKSGLQTIHFPSFSEQVGFKDQFRVADLPISTIQKEDEKVFVSELRPMHENLLEIPSIAFSYFDPNLEEYKTIYSHPISLTVLPLKSKMDFSLDAPLSTIEEKKELAAKHQDRNEINWIEEQKPSLIDIEGVYNIEDTNPFKANWCHEKEIAFALVLLWLLQLLYKKFSIVKEKKLDSLYYLDQAMKFDDQLHKYPFLIEKALLLKLQEVKKIPHLLTVDQLPQEELCIAVKEFIHHLQMQLFAKDQDFSFEKSYQQAKLLYKKIQESI